MSETKEIMELNSTKMKGFSQQAQAKISHVTVKMQVSLFCLPRSLPKLEQISYFCQHTFWYSQEVMTNHLSSASRNS